MQRSMVALRLLGACCALATCACATARHASRAEHESAASAELASRRAVELSDLSAPDGRCRVLVDRTSLASPFAAQQPSVVMFDRAIDLSRLNSQGMQGHVEAGPLPSNDACANLDAMAARLAGMRAAMGQ
ncbi:hypothetical protein LVJ94_21560 [Pendulispora rubella]|uniref:Lipoprotein n=1 Tax=Pendulispora rubella TaxID=2741070 RepID=A0ABZ2LHF5_9BACT